MIAEPKSILVIQTAFVGDLLLGIPLLKRVRRLDPAARISLYCRKGLGSFLLKAGLVDEIIEVDKRSGESFRAAGRRLHSHQWDWIICPHESPRTHALVWRLRAGRKTGYRHFWNGLVFTERVSRPMARPEALRQLALIAADDEDVRIGIEADVDADSGVDTSKTLSRLCPVPAWASMEVEALRQVREMRMRDSNHSGFSHGRGSGANNGKGTIGEGVARLLGESALAFAQRHGLLDADRIAFLAPGSVWPTKMWKESGYIACAREFLKRGFRVVLMGAPDERAICERIAAQATGAAVLSGETDLWQSAELLAFSDILICNDSGAMHMAAAAGVPSVAVFGPTTLKLGYRPWQTNARIAQADLSCRPCGKHGAERCPLGTHECMTRVAVTEVLKLADELLACVSR